MLPLRGWRKEMQMIPDHAAIGRRQFAGLVGGAALGGVVSARPGKQEVALAADDWNVVLNQVNNWLAEIAQFTDDDEEYLAVKEVVFKIEQQLPERPSGCPGQTLLGA